jgi:hypothetical protein
MAGRGIDFEHKFKTSRWAEDLLLKSICDQPGLVAVRFGLSEVRAARDVKYDKASWKEPDLLVFKTEDLTKPELKILEAGEFYAENRDKFRRGGELNFVTAKACVAIEVEFSPYKASEMKDRDWKPRTAERWAQRQLKHANPPIAPNIWVKEEDLSRLNGWENEFGVPIMIAHLFDQEAFAVKLQAVSDFNSSFCKSEKDQVRLQVTTGIFKKEQSYDRSDAQGAGEKKTVFVITPAVATKIGDVKEVKVKAQLNLSASKKYVTHCLFTDGHITFSPGFLVMLKNMRS